MNDAGGADRTSKLPILIAVGLVIAAGAAFGVSRYRDATDRAGFGDDQCGGVVTADAGPKFGDAVRETESVVLTGPTGIAVCLVAPEGATLRTAVPVVAAASRLDVGQPTAGEVDAAAVLAAVEAAALTEGVPDGDTRPVQVAVGWVLGCSGTADTDERETIGSMRVTYEREGIELTAIVDTATDYVVTVPADCG